MEETRKTVVGDYSEFDDETLEAMKLECDQRIGQLREKKREIAAEQDKRLVHASVQRRIATMNDAEKAALLQILQPVGIEESK